LPTVAAFMVSAPVFIAADAGWIDGPLRTVLPALAPLLPGALIVTGISELAAGHRQAGASRLIDGIVPLGLFAVGLIGATAALQVPPEAMGNVRIDGIGWWAAPFGATGGVPAGVLAAGARQPGAARGNHAGGRSGPVGGVRAERGRGDLRDRARAAGRLVDGAGHARRACAQGRGRRSPERDGAPGPARSTRAPGPYALRITCTVLPVTRCPTCWP